MKGDYKVPPKLAEKIADAYEGIMVTDPDSGESILNDWSQAKILKNCGQEITDPEKMSNWLQYNLPELFEIFLKKNNEL